MGVELWARLSDLKGEEGFASVDVSEQTFWGGRSKKSAVGVEKRWHGLRSALAGKEAVQYGSRPTPPTHIPTPVIECIILQS
jgi:hypothetical protein